MRMGSRDRGQRAQEGGFGRHQMYLGWHSRVFKALAEREGVKSGQDEEDFGSRERAAMGTAKGFCYWNFGSRKRKGQK